MAVADLYEKAAYVARDVRKNIAGYGVSTCFRIMSNKRRFIDILG